MSEIQQRIAALETQLADLKALVGGEPTEVLSSRRDFARKAALGVAGLAAAGVAGAVAAAGPAAASNGDPILLGTIPSQDLTNPTGVRYDNAALPHGSTVGVKGNVFMVTDHPSSSPTDLDSAYPAAVAGSAERILLNGVYGTSMLTNGFGAVGAGGGNATGVLARGATRANLELFSEGVAGPARLVPHNAGEIVNDASHDVWLCVTAGNPRVWRKTGGPSTSGQLHLTTPGRVYDSRDGGAKHVFGATDRVVTVTTVAAGHSTAGTVVVPAGAAGILANLTVTATEGAGFLGVYSNALATWPGNSSINWVATDQDTANQVTTAIDATGKIKVNIGGQGAATQTHFVIDVLGYYL